jgi:hypothetical protein
MNQKINIQAVKIKALATLLLIFVAGHTIYSQPEMKVQDGRFCEGAQVLLPVLVDGFEQISSFTLYLGFDAQTVTFVDIKNRHEQFNTGSLMSTFHPNNGDPVLIITWVESNNNPATVPAGKLFDLRLDYAGGQSDVFFKSGCEISIGMSPVANAIFKDGSIAPVEITAQPQAQFIAQDQQAEFSVEVNGEVLYQWLVKSGDNWNSIEDDERYWGTKTGNLVINNTPKEFDNQLYRCQMTAGACSLFSEAAMLHVSPLTTGKPKSNAGYLVFPNPFTDMLHVRINDAEPQQIAWRMFSGNGMIVAGESTPAVSGNVNINAVSGLPAGVYFLQVFNGELLTGTTKLLKH